MERGGERDLGNRSVEQLCCHLFRRRNLLGVSRVTAKLLDAALLLPAKDLGNCQGLRNLFWAPRPGALLTPLTCFGFWATQPVWGHLFRRGNLFGVWGLGFGVWGVGFGVWGLGFGVWGLGFGVWGLGFRVLPLGFKI
jgi:hypothetical protein